MGLPTPVWLKQSASLKQDTRGNDGLSKAFFLSVASDEQLVELLGFGQETLPATNRSGVSSTHTGFSSALGVPTPAPQHQPGGHKPQSSGGCFGTIVPTEKASATKYSCKVEAATFVPQQTSLRHLPCGGGARGSAERTTSCRPDPSSLSSHATPMATQQDCPKEGLKGDTFSTANNKLLDSAHVLCDARGSPSTQLATAFLRGTPTGSLGPLPSNSAIEAPAPIATLSEFSRSCRPFKTFFLPREQKNDGEIQAAEVDPTQTSSACVREKTNGDGTISKHYSASGVPGSNAQQFRLSICGTSPPEISKKAKGFASSQCTKISLGSLQPCQRGPEILVHDPQNVSNGTPIPAKAFFYRTKFCIRPALMV